MTASALFWTDSIASSRYNGMFAQSCWYSIFEDTSYKANIHFNNVTLGNTGFLENANGVQPFVGLLRNVNEDIEDIAQACLIVRFEFREMLWIDEKPEIAMSC